MKGLHDSHHAVEKGNEEINQDDIAEVEEMMEKVTNDMFAVMSNQQARDFLNRILDGSMLMINSEDFQESLNAIDDVVTQLSELLRDNHARELIINTLDHVDTFFVDPKVHAHVTGLIDVGYKLTMDPNIRKRKEEALNILEHIMNDEEAKAYTGLALVHALRTVQSMDAMNLMTDSLIALNNIVSSSTARSLILNQLHVSASR